MDLSKLNKEQREAVVDTEGAVLVLAGAGSGKTTVLTCRIAYLISCGINPHNILAITFTNKAAREMTERVYAITNISSIWTSTFHSFCAKILRYDIDKLGYTSDYTIYDESDQKHILKRILKEKRIEDDKFLSSVIWHIDNAKNLGYSPEKYYQEMEGAGRQLELICEIYEAYEDAMHRANALDFDDLLIKTIELFEQFPSVLEKYQKRFQYVLVDEFQDTNAIQLKLIKYLSGYFGNVFAVGDDDQSIYGWRGADISNILEFEEKFKNVKIHKLEQNYRSTNAILEVANRLILNNEGRHDKQLWSERGKGARVEYLNFYDDKEEARAVINSMRDLRYHFGYDYSDFGILLRVNSISRNFENALSEAGIPYKVYGGFKFWERKEILDVVAYLRAVVNPRDTEAFSRIINFPPRGIGESTVQALLEESKRRYEDIGDTILKIDDTELSSQQKKKISAFRDIYCDLISHIGFSLTEFASRVVEIAGFEKYYKTGVEEDVYKWENIGEFVSAVKDFEEKNEDATLSSYLQNIALTQNNEEDIGNFVTLSTVHAVKGLEFKTVYIVGVEEDIFPSSMSKDNPKDLEEERRVMYVAVTRAKDRLAITNARRRARFGKYIDCRPSRFIHEMKGEPKEQLQVKHFDEFSDDYDRLPAAPQKVTYKFNKTPDIKPTVSVGNFNKGTRVNHKSFGNGTIIEIKGEGKNRVAVVAFESAGFKTLALSVAPLTILD